MDKKNIFLDGVWVDVTERFIKSLSPGVLKARGVFETMRAYPGLAGPSRVVIFKAKDHLIRLKEGLSVLKIKITYSSEELKRLMLEALRKNQLEEGRLRLMIWAHGSKVRVAVIVWPYHAFFSAEYQKGFQVCISKIKRNEKFFSPGIKSLDYFSLLKAYQRARRQGNDEALLLNSHGKIAEASRANIFWIKDQELLTPSLECGCLNGITRQTVIGLARKMGIKVRMVQASPAELLEADEAFLTNSVMEVMPLTEIKGKTIGKGMAGALTRKILAGYRRLIAN